MIPSGVQVFLALEPVDLRSGFERLAGLARERIGYDSRSGALFVFVGKRRTATKVLFFDGTGMCVLHKRLDRGAFAVPEIPADGVTHLEINEGQLEALLDGIAIAAASAAAPTPRRRTH